MRPERLVRRISKVTADEQSSHAIANGHPAPLLLTGETGTGKTIVAKLVHRRGPRRNAPFEPIVYAEVPGARLDEQLYGREAGAPTDARSARPGLFVGTDDAGEVNAIFTSLLASCQMHGVEPWTYLRDLLCVLPLWPAHRVLELAPLHWPSTSAGDEVSQVLGANPYRALTLG